VPVAGLVARGYLAERSAADRPTAPLPSRRCRARRPGAAAGSQADTPHVEFEASTSHFVVDRPPGRRCRYTSTIESAFGSGLVVNGYFLNNELTDFSLEPRTATDGRSPTGSRAASGRAVR
jgi:gamma-glutamyltranspeptidase/glutathione hydrolase